MNKLKKLLSYILVAALSSAATFGLLAYDELQQRKQGSGKLQELQALLEERFIGEVDRKTLEDSAANGMVEGLGDRWSYYMTAEGFASYMEQMTNSYVGVGITVKKAEDGTIHIMEVVENGPAASAGVLAGGFILKVDGTDVTEMELNDVSLLIKGEEGTDVTMTIRYDDGEKDITVTRAAFQVTVAQGQMLRDNIGYITIENFDDRCADETIAAIGELLEQGAEGLIFDVRFNPGGYKHELVKVLDYLLPEGPLFRSFYYDGTEQVDESDADFLDIPMAVIVNAESISAAEFFAAALSEYEAATVVGQQTIGKGYFQQAFPLSDGSAVGLSVGRYTTPNNVSLIDVGITPDVVVEVEEELFYEIYYGNVSWEEDPQIQAALDVLTGN